MSDKKRWPVLIHECEKEIIVVRDDASLIHYLKNNDPSEASYCELLACDESKIESLFAGDPDSGFAGPLSWNDYAEQLGLNPIT